MQVLKVSTPAHLRRFIDFPYRLYQGHPYCVPPLRLDMKTQLSPARHPFYRHSSHAFFLVTYNGRDLGRMAIFHNRRHNEVYQVNVGMFGYLDMVDDVEVTSALMESARSWLKQFGVTSIQGPYNPDINGSIGILMDAYEAPPMVLMPYNYPYYKEHLENLDFSKLKDMSAYEMYASKGIPQRLIDLVGKMEERGGYTIRKVDMKRFWDEVELVKEIYNQAWAENWGALWMDDEEYTHMAKDLKLLIDPDLVYLAEMEGKIVGVSISLPNINEALAHLPNGRLFPLGLFRLLWYKRRISSLRILILGVLQPYRRFGIDAALYLRTFTNGIAKGYLTGEASWILEDNASMINALLKMGARKSKTYRIYSRSITMSESDS
ncbi:MAG: N-acetyltransferase [Fidelibacterota bacterium]|nr:MAG: N-acetyltransferase [Candidatus Neomarinimicrobiota bacterium]